MSILFHCPRCHDALKADDRLAGILGYCPKCSGTLLFPGPQWIPPEEESRLGPEERLAERQGLLDRLRPVTAVAWLISLAVHMAIAALLWAVAWLVAAPAAEAPEEYKVNILLDLGQKDGTLQYRGPRDIVLKKQATPQEDLLGDLTRDRPPSELIEVGPAQGAPVLRLTDLDFEKGPAGSGFSTQFMGLGARGESFVYIVDKSGSMEMDERLDAAKAELRFSIERLPYAAKFHVMFYEDSDFKEAPSDKLVNASRSNKDRCYRVMAQVQARGGTDPMKAFLKAFKMQPDVIFFLTDGELNQVGDIVARVRRMNTEHAGGKTTVHTIGFINDMGERVLKKIAEENHGSYRFVSRAEATRLRQRHETPAEP
ncbi:MAG: hypothetical protein AMS14_05155 [Planctomycetes bacterium DG_20]|nr:MAG: hypothetical protein AMS14_05155 [Planctomycetes bacterium DG_20]